MTPWQFLLMLLGLGGFVWLTSCVIMRLWRDPEWSELSEETRQMYRDEATRPPHQ